MSSTDKEKIEQLLLKVKALGQRVRSSRDSFGSPVTDRVATRLDKLLTRLPQNGDSNPRQPQQPQELKNCPKCFKQLAQDVRFCEKCGFDFQGLEREQVKAAFEREKCERAGRVGVLF